MNINRVFYGLCLFFFWLMLFVPTAYQIERGALLGLLLVAAMVYSFRTNNWRLHKETAFWGGLCVTASLFFMANGAFYGSPGALNVGTVYVAWPLLYLFFMGTIHRPEQFPYFLKILVLGVICAAMLGILFVTEALGFHDLGILGLSITEKGGYGLSEDFVKYSMPNETTVIYGFPFLLAWLMLPREKSNLNGSWRLSVLFGLLLSVIVLFISGRRIFWVVAALSPFVALLLLRFSGIRSEAWNMIRKIIFVFVVMGGGVVLITGINMDAIWTDFMTAFEFSNAQNPSAYLRAQQSIALLDGWMDNPILGAGHGAGAPDLIRADDEPWAYEMSYLALLFQTGIMGVFIYGSAVAWLIVRAIGVMRKQPESAGVLIPLLSGLLCFLIANASNPYLLKFDYLWTLFLPVAVLNAYLLKRRKESVSSL